MSRECQWSYAEVVALVAHADEVEDTLLREVAAEIAYRLDFLRLSGVPLRAWQEVWQQLEARLRAREGRGRKEGAR